MPKKDPIFWWAAAIFIAAIVVYAVTGEQLWLALMIVSYLLRPTLASLGMAKNTVDERQMSLQYRSGNIAFAVMMATAVALAAVQSAKGDPNWDLFNIVILVGLATKALFNVLLTRNYREGAAKIIMAVGLMIALFGAMSHGLSITGMMEALPGLAIAAIGWLSRRYPRVVGTVVFAATVALLTLIFSKGFTTGQFATAALICIPMALAGLCLFLPNRDDSGPDAARPGTI